MAKVDEMEAELAALRTVTDLAVWRSAVAGMAAECERLATENTRLRAERDLIAARFSRFAWTGKFGLDDAFHTKPGLRMAGLGDGEAGN